MRAVLLIVLSVVCCFGAYFLLAGGEPPPLVPPTTPTTPGPAGPTAPAARGEDRIEVPDPTPPPVRPAEPGPTPTPPTVLATEPNLVLAVRDLTTRAPVPSFRWQFRNSRGTQRGTGTAGHAELALEASAVGQLLVEADGLSPLVRDGVIVPTPPARAATLDLFLAPAVTAAGIVLHVRDLGLQPIANVRVDAWALAADAPPTGWQLGQALWARRAMAADGRYALPTLAAGQYGIRVVATDAEGALLPLQPYLRTFTLTGDNGFVEDVPLEPGALLTLDLVDAAGQPYDPAQRGSARLSLHLVGGPDVSRKWLVRNEVAEAAAIDVVPGVGKVQLGEAVVGGPYQLEVSVMGTTRVQRQLFLRPGQRQEERVLVP